MKDIYLTIVSPERVVYDGKVSRVTFPGESGSFEVLWGHAALISVLKAGDIAYTADGDERKQHISGGFVEVNDNQVSACVEL